MSAHYFPKLIGPQIALAPADVEDSALYAAWINDLHTAIPLGTAAQALNLESERRFVEQQLKDASRQIFGIYLHAEQTLLGNISLFEINHLHRSASVGLFLGQAEFRGKGYGSEALSLAVEYGFRVLNLDNIMLRLASFNEAGFKAYTKVGFREFGRRKGSLKLNGQAYDEIYMEICPEWLQVRHLDWFFPQ